MVETTTINGYTTINMISSDLIRATFIVKSVFLTFVSWPQYNGPRITRYSYFLKTILELKSANKMGPLTATCCWRRSKNHSYKQLSISSFFEACWLFCSNSIDLFRSSFWLVMLYTDETAIPCSFAMSSFVLFFFSTKRIIRTTLGQKLFHMSKTNPIRYGMLFCWASEAPKRKWKLN